MIERLVEYARGRPDLPPSCYRIRDIEWILDITGDGVTVQPYDERDAVPTMRRSSTRPMPFLCVDQAAYVLGCHGDGVTEQQASKRATAFWTQMGQWVAGEHQHTAAVAGLALLHQYGTAFSVHEVPPRARVAVRVEGIFLHRLPEAVREWQAIVAAQKGGGQGFCIACRQTKTLAATLPNAIPAHLIPGAEREAQLTVLPLQSRGKDSLAVCVPCGDLATSVLETLLADNQHTARLPGQDSATVAFGLGPPEADEAATELLAQVMRGEPHE